MRQKALAGLVVFLVVTALGCEGYHRAHGPLTKQTIQKHGSWVYNGSYRAVAKATVMALQADGFSVPLVNLHSGLLMTRPKVISVRAVQGEWYGSPSLSTTAVQMLARLKPLSGGRVRVTLEPRIYHGQSAYQLRENQAYLVQPIWSRVLRGIYDALPRMGAQRRQPAALPTTPAPSGQPPALPKTPSQPQTPSQPGQPPPTPAPRGDSTKDTHL